MLKRNKLTWNTGGHETTQFARNYGLENLLSQVEL